MNIKILLNIFSCDFKDGEAYLFMPGELLQCSLPENQEHILDVLIGLVEDYTEVQGSWLEYKLVENTIFGGRLYLVYTTMIPFELIDVQKCIPVRQFLKESNYVEEIKRMVYKASLTI